MQAAGLLTREQAADSRREIVLRYRFRRPAGRLDPGTAARSAERRAQLDATSSTRCAGHGLRDLAAEAGDRFEPGRSGLVLASDDGPVRGLADDQARNRVPAHDPQGGLQMGRELMQDHAPAAVMARPLRFAQEDQSAQAREITELHAGQIDVNLTRSAGHIGQRGEEAVMSELVDVPGNRQPGRAAGAGNPQRSVVEYDAIGAGTRDALSSAAAAGAP
jgi:hypothetical protein